MRINGIIWLRDVIDKLAFKHRVEQEEVEEVFRMYPSSVSLKKESEREKMYTWRSGKATREGIWR
jgi:hypothetical protein